MQFSIPVVLIYAAASFVGALMAFGSRDQRPAMTLLASVVVTIVAVLVLIVLRWLITADRDVDVLVFFLISLGVGVARGSVMMVVGTYWGLLEQNSPIAQIVNSAISAVIWLFLAGLVLASRERYRRSYCSLLVQGATHLHDDADIDADWDRNPNIVNMRASVLPHLSAAQAAPSAASLTRTAEAIRVEIEQTLRPLSHRLWFGAYDEYPRVRLSQLIMDSITAFRMPVRVIGIAWFIGGFIGGPMLFGATRGRLAAIVSTGVLVLLLLAFKANAGRHPSFLLGLTYLIASGTVPLIAADVALRALGFESDFTWATGLVVLLPLALITMMVMGLSIAMANADRAQVISVAKRHAGGSGIGFTNALAASTYLHNTVLAELHGVVLQLQQAAQSGDPDRSRAAVEHAQEIMSRSLTAQFLDQRMNPETHIARVAKAWQGICDVDIAIEPGVRNDPRGSVAIQAVEELIANAVRHSGATRVSASLVEAPDGVSITCRIDREWQGTHGQGMGSRWLSALSRSGVVAKRSTGETILQLTIM